MSAYLAIAFGCFILADALTRRRFLNVSEGANAGSEGFVPRWYHRLAFAMLGTGLIGYGVYSIWTTH